MSLTLRELLRGSAFLRAVRFLPYIVTYRLWTLLTRPHRDRYLFLSDSHDGFVGNFHYLRTELLRQEPEADVRGVFKPRLRARRGLADAIRLPYLLATSGTIIVDDFYPLIYPLRIREGARLLQVWHAVGAFKQVGHSRTGLPGGPPAGSSIHRNYTDATVSSEPIRKDYAEAYGIDISRVRALGVPRTDPFFDDAHVSRVRSHVRARLGIPDGRRLVLFAPTFRGNGQLTATVDTSADWSAIASALGSDFQLVVRVHPFTARNAPPLPPGVIDGSEGEMNDLLMATDVLVTDYSSSIFEFALLRRPFVLFTPDLADYAGARSFYRPIEAYAIGPIVQDPQELADAIRSAEVDPQQLDAFLTEFCGALDGHSSERIVREVLRRAPDQDRTRATVDSASVAPGGSDPTPTRASGAIGLRVAVAYVARATLTLVYAPLKLLPTQRKVVMISREHTNTPDDFIDLRDAILRKDPSVRVVMLVKMVPPGLVGKLGYAIHMLRQLFHVATAQVLVVDTYAIVASVLHHKPSLTVIQIWHALGAFKKFGMSILGQNEGRDARLAKAMRMHEGYDIVLASGEPARAPFSEALNTPLHRVRAMPLPRVDRLLDTERSARMRDRILRAHPQLVGQRIAVFAPTFRLDGGVTIDTRRLSEALAEINITLVLKLHPLMGGHFDGSVETADGYSTQDVLHIADVFITDYSSALFEAALLGVPTYFIAPDLDEYLASRDFYMDYRADLPGPVVNTIPALVNSIAAGSATSDDARAFASRWVNTPQQDASSATACADAIADDLIGRMMVSPG